jgi:hypothetical protein
MSDTGEDEGKRAEIVMLRWKCSIDDNEGPNSPDDSILVPYLDGLATCTNQIWAHSQQETAHLDISIKSSHH